MRPLREGIVKKSGTNEAPSMPRPSFPGGQDVVGIERDCLHCLWWDRYKSKMPNPIGCCRASSPQVASNLEDGDDFQWGVWPVTYGGEWCARWKPDYE